MYLVAKEVLNDLTALQLLPILFQHKQVERNPNIILTEEILAKVYFSFISLDLDLSINKTCDCWSFFRRWCCCSYLDLLTKYIP